MDDIPMGLGMALAKDFEAMQYFASLPQAQKDQIIAQTHQIRSRDEMRAFVRSLCKPGNTQNGGNFHA